MRQFVLRSRYYYSCLSEVEKRIYREIYNCWASGDTEAEIILPGTGFELPTGMSLFQLVGYIIEENPQLFHLETAQLYYTRMGTTVTIRADAVYSQSEYWEIYGKLLDRVDHILKMTDDCHTEYDKLLFLHDYLAENITFDIPGDDSRSARESHTIVGALLRGACVCDGYARAYRLLCDQMHISCTVMIGKSTESGNEEAHAWNLVKINGSVYHVDVTWDSRLITDSRFMPDYYFLRSDDLFAKDHVWDAALYPPAPEDYPREECTVSSKWEFEQSVCAKLRAGIQTVKIQFADSFLKTYELGTLLNGVTSRNPGVFTGIGRFDHVFFRDINYAMIRFIKRGENGDGTGESV